MRRYASPPRTRIVSWNRPGLFSNLCKEHLRSTPKDGSPNPAKLGLDQISPTKALSESRTARNHSEFFFPFSLSSWSRRHLLQLKAWNLVWILPFLSVCLFKKNFFTITLLLLWVIIHTSWPWCLQWASNGELYYDWVMVSCHVMPSCIFVVKATIWRRPVDKEKLIISKYYFIM